MTETPYFLEYRSSKSPNVLPTPGGEQGLGQIREPLPPGPGLQNQGEIEDGDDDANEVDADYLYFDWNGSATQAPRRMARTMLRQVERPPHAKARTAKESDSQWDIGASFYEALTNSTSGNGTQQTPSNGMGGMAEIRHIVKPLLGYELSVAFNRRSGLRPQSRRLRP